MIGTIVAFTARAGSGMAHIQFRNEDGLEVNVPCDNGMTCRALNAMFPGFIIRGHAVDPQQIIGEMVEYEVDDLGLLVNLAPV